MLNSVCSFFVTVKCGLCFIKLLYTNMSGTVYFNTITVLVFIYSRHVICVLATYVFINMLYLIISSFLRTGGNRSLVHKTETYALNIITNTNLKVSTVLTKKKQKISYLRVKNLHKSHAIQH